MIGFNRRFDPNFAALKAAVDRDEIGKTELLSVTSFDPAPPPVSYVKVSGGLFRDMMIHDFDMTCWLMGGLPEAVTAVGSSIVDPEVGAAGDVDTAVVTLAFADGRIAVIKNSRRAVHGCDQRVELLGSEGLLSAGNVVETPSPGRRRTECPRRSPSSFSWSATCALTPQSGRRSSTRSIRGRHCPSRSTMVSTRLSSQKL